MIELPQKLSELAEDPRNPRQISITAQDGLKYSMSKFGSLDGTVYNRRTGQLVTGHRRKGAGLEELGDAVIEMYDEEYGSLVYPDGKKFPYRVVDVSPEEQMAMNIAANAPTIQGTFDMPLLEAQLFEIQGFDVATFEALDFESLIPKIDIGPMQGSMGESMASRLANMGDESAITLTFGREDVELTKAAIKNEGMPTLVAHIMKWTREYA